MGIRRWHTLGMLALAALARPAAAQPLVTPAAMDTTRGGELGIVRVLIDKDIGEQDAAVRKLLEALPFVRIGGPADYFLTTRSDFPLDIILIDATEPAAMWTAQLPTAGAMIDNPGPEVHRIGNLLDPDTEVRLRDTLLAAARIRAMLDRSLADPQGLSMCVLERSEGEAGQASSAPPQCHPIDGKDLSAFRSSNEVLGLRVTNTSDSPRYVAMVLTDHYLGVRPAATDGDASVRMLAPGESVLLQSWIDVSGFGTRAVALSSARPFSLDNIVHPRPLGDRDACDPNQPVKPACTPATAGVALNPDIAARSILFHAETEPMPAMGNGADAIAGMATFMAQFYSTIPYTKAEILADSKLDEQNTQFLAQRTPQERQHRCGASLIAPNLIVTAAHCVAKGQYAGDGLTKVMKQRRVRLGSLKIGEEGNTFAINGVAVHPGYDAINPSHDIAILMIANDRGTGPRGKFRQLAVAEKPLPGGVKARAFGWGLTGSVTPKGNIMLTGLTDRNTNPEVLQYGDLYSVSLPQCAKRLPGEVKSGMVCMFSKEALRGQSSGEGVFTCRGDSGGPLIRSVGGRDVLVGLVSWSKGCGYKTMPSVFTDVGSYAGWIAAASKALKPGLAIRPADPTRPTLGTGRR